MKNQTAASEAWSYSGATGPEHWGRIAPVCANGRRQSPIDLDRVTRADLEPIRFDYDVRAREIFHSGHAVGIRFVAGAAFRTDGRTYHLDHLHFHVPGEHRIAGKSFALEAHFVHADDAGNVAVAALLYNLGAADPTLVKIEPRLKLEAQEHQPLDGALSAADFLPEDREYYFYNGSLTTPPCTEGVDWFVLMTQLTVSQEQAEALMQAVGGSNNRPLQAPNGRQVLAQRQE